MSAQVIDGEACARSLKETLAADIKDLREDGYGLGLATIIVGDSYSSTAYERRLRRLASELDVPYFPHSLPATVSQRDLLATIEELNTAQEVSGILVLRPLPPQISEPITFRAISPEKDIESVHPENAGLLALGVPRYVPSTAASAYHLLDSWLDSVDENKADFYHRSLIVVVGRSNNVGKPAVSLGYDRQAAVESVDVWASRTGGLGRYTRRADVLIVAAGQPGLIKAEHVNDQAIVIDVGINPQVGHDGRVRMVGDVDYGPVASRVRAITPVPGGVGPVTDVWLLRNTATAGRLMGNACRAADQRRAGSAPASGLESA
jgi:methylenetetrahydrofolate dehydrogenase (NADP+)/methenyltetrahydrofolate cyclohydrolase